MAVKLFCSRKWQRKKVIQISPLSRAYIFDIIKKQVQVYFFKKLAWIRTEDRVYISQFPLGKNKENIAIWKWSKTRKKVYVRSHLKFIKKITTSIIKEIHRCIFAYKCVYLCLVYVCAQCVNFHLIKKFLWPRKGAKSMRQNWFLPNRYTIRQDAQAVVCFISSIHAISIDAGLIVTWHCPCTDHGWNAELMTPKRYQSNVRDKWANQ